MKNLGLIQRGSHKGVFQLESNLGRSWSKKLAPNNLEELSALIALIRPGCLKAITDGKSMTQHYVDRKHKKKKQAIYINLLKIFLNLLMAFLFIKNSL